MTHKIYRNLAARWRVLVALCAVALLGLTGTIATAAPDRALTLGVPFTDNLVLQRDRTVSVWGTGQPGATITVAVATAVAQALVDDAGHWLAILPPMAATREATLSVSSSTGEALVLHHVAVGDVWLCSGQSNMELEVRQASNEDQVISQSVDADLHLLLVPRQRLAQAGTQFAQESLWQTANADSVRGFSATCYFMGKELRQRTHVPIGLIAASWGGSRIEDWLSRESLGALTGFDHDLALLDQHSRAPAEAERRADLALERWLAAHGRARNATPAPTGLGNPSAGLWELWGNDALSNFDGIGVYRTTVELSAEQAAAAQSLVIGNVDDIDLTLVNGQRVGLTIGWNVPRNYPLTARQVHAGRNTIEIIVMDTGGGGGIWGNQPRGLMLDGGVIVPFEPQWRFARGAALSDLGTVPTPPWAGGGGLASLHNGMIAPLGDYRVSGVAWFQGETNAARASAYRPLLTALIDDWRTRFGIDRFLIVQLASFGAMTETPAQSSWAELREVQRSVANSRADISLIPTIDIGDPYDIHPTNKREVGRRLALATTLPNWDAGTVITPEVQGDRIILRLGRGYRLLGGVTHPTGFETCDGQGQCHFVDATLLSADQISIPIATGTREVRYLWANSPLVSLFDSDGVPLGPFQLMLNPR